MKFYVLICVYGINGARDFLSGFWQLFVILSVMNVMDHGNRWNGGDFPCAGRDCHTYNVTYLINQNRSPSGL